MKLIKFNEILREKCLTETIILVSGKFKKKIEVNPKIR
jgi:hypothetical protein